MTRNFDKEFWDIVIYDASRDARLREVVAWVIDDTVTLENVPEPDYLELTNIFQKSHGLNGDQLGRAMSLAESELVKHG